MKPKDYEAGGVRLEWLRLPSPVGVRSNDASPGQYPQMVTATHFQRGDGFAIELHLRQRYARVWWETAGRAAVTNVCLGEGCSWGVEGEIEVRAPRAVPPEPEGPRAA